MTIIGTEFFPTEDGGEKLFLVARSANQLLFYEIDSVSLKEGGSLVLTISTAKKSFELSMIP